jgi:3-phenylpropionate/trans-cinnamate dioxygenase ferredoxin reductase subunit
VTEHFDHLVVGGGFAGGRAIQALTKLAPSARLGLVCAEVLLPYDRTVVSKSLLSGAASTSVAPLVDYSANEALTVYLGDAAVGLDAADHEVTLSSGEKLQYNSLLIATGVRARRLPGDECHYLRTVADAVRLRPSLIPGSRVVIVGGGFIGCEVASAAAAAGARVTILERENALLGAFIGEALGSVVARHLTAQGVEIVTSFDVAAVVRSTVESHDGRRITGDAVVAGIGVETDAAWMPAVCGSSGVQVDSFCATGVADIWAAGDVTSWWSERYQRYVRVQHESSAQQQGLAAARNMAGRRTPFDALPYVWCQLNGLEVWQVGLPGRVAVPEIWTDGAAIVGVTETADGISSAIGINAPERLAAARAVLEGRSRDGLFSGLRRVPETRCQVVPS